MATERNITMKQFNGTDYDTLYPKTIASQVEGVYNKEETISDSTKTLYGLPSTAVPDDAFKKMLNKVNETSDTINPVGTIQTTVRTDLGSNWLLCDGSSFDPTEYPDLADVLSSDTLTVKTLLSSDKVYGLVYENNLWVAVSGGNVGELQVSYTNDPVNTWTNKRLASSNAHFCRFRYVNGYYVILAYNSSSPYALSIYYAQDVSGGWTQKTIYSNNASKSWKCADIIYFKNEYCVIAPSSQGGNNFSCYHASALSGTWIETVVPLDDYSILYNISAATDGNILGVLGAQSDSDEVGNIVCFCNTTDITGEWTKHLLTTSSTNFCNSPELIYGNGYFVCFGKTSYTTPYLWIKYTSANNINFVDVAVNTNQNGSNGTSGIYYNNNFYILANLASNINLFGTVYSNIPTGPWKEGNSFTKISNAGYFCLAMSNSHICIGLYDYSNYVGKVFVLQKKYLLPTITADKSYVYIKAKKDSET